MAVDVRGYTVAIGPEGSLGRVVSGQVSDSYISGGVGLVKTSGHVVVQGFVSPKAGTRVTLRTSFPRGNTYQLPRFLRVLSSTIIPQDRTTRIELGCKLKFFEDLADDFVFHSTLGLVSRANADSAPESFNAAINSMAVLASCASQVGLSITGSMNITFARQYLDLSAGYVTVMDQLIASSGQIGYLTSDERLILASAQLRATSGRSLGESRIISVSPIGIGQRPADSVAVSYNALKLKADDGTEKTQAAWGSEWNELFGRSSSSSRSTIVVPYQNPATSTQAVATFDVRDVTEEESTYEVVNGKNLLKKRVQQERKSSVAVAGAVVTDYLSAGVAWGAGTVESTTTETFSYDKQGREVQRQLVREADRLYGLGSLGLPMSFPSADPEAPGGVDLVPVPTGKMVLERTITTTYRTRRFQKTVTQRFGPWIQTPMGQQTVAESREYFDTAAKVSDFIGLALDGSFLLDVSVSTQLAADTEEAAPSTWDTSLPNLVADEADAEDDYRGEQVVESVYAVGSGPPPFLGYQPALPDLTGLSVEEIAALTLQFENGRVPTRRILLTIPYADDDRLIKLPGATAEDPPTYRVAKGNAQGQAITYGRIYNDLLVGLRYGLALQVGVRDMPPLPFTAVAVSIAGTSGMFRANALSWTISNDGIVGSIDALFAGGIGGPTYSFPIAEGVTAPTTLPTESNNEPDQVIGTVEAVGEDPDATLDAAFPDAVTGDGVQDLTTLSYWVYNGATWDDVGDNPGPTVTVTPLPVVSETSIVRLRTRHRLAVREFDYALTLPVQTVQVRSRHRLTVRPITPTYVPAAAVAVAGLAPTVNASLEVPAAAIAVAGHAPLVVTPVVVPAAAVTVQGVAPAIQTDAPDPAPFLLLHFDGTDGSTTITDSSTNAFTMTAGGNAQLTTTSPKFGTAQLVLDGNGDTVRTPNSAPPDIWPGTGDFTIDFWATPTRTSGYNFLVQLPEGSGENFNLFIHDGNWKIHDNSGTPALATTMATATLDTQVHILVSRESGTVRFFVDGVQQGGDVSMATNFTSAVGLRMLIGATTSNCYQGRIDEFRYVKGTATETANFTPPTGPYS